MLHPLVRYSPGHWDEPTSHPSKLKKRHQPSFESTAALAFDSLVWPAEGFRRAMLVRHSACFSGSARRFFGMPIVYNKQRIGQVTYCVKGESRDACFYWLVLSLKLNPCSFWKASVWFDDDDQPELYVDYGNPTFKADVVEYRGPTE